MITMQSAAMIADETFVASAIVRHARTASRSRPASALRELRRGPGEAGKLPPIGLRPLVYVYKCGGCNQIISIEPERHDSPTISPTVTPPMLTPDIKKAPHGV